MIAAIELGGTKTICAVCDKNGSVEDYIVIKTGIPKDTVGEISDYFNSYNINEIGIASFGPLELNKDSMNYGSILNSPKVDWRGFNILRTLEGTLGCSAVIDTDVNCSCLGEYYYGNYKFHDPMLYITIGTGIGVGLVINGKTYHGKRNLEIGHMVLDVLLYEKSNSVCPFHDSCVEGLASGPAIEKRYGTKPENIPDSHFAWKNESDLISTFVYNCILGYSPECIIMGGGVMKREFLLSSIKDNIRSLDNKYFLDDDTGCIISTPSLGDLSAVYGCISLCNHSEIKRF